MEDGNTPEADTMDAQELAGIIYMNQAGREDIAALVTLQKGRERIVAGALETWGAQHFGSSAAWHQHVASLGEWSAEHVRKSLQDARSQRVLVMAEQVFLNAHGMEPKDSPPVASGEAGSLEALALDVCRLNVDRGVSIGAAPGTDEAFQNALTRLFFALRPEAENVPT